MKRFFAERPMVAFFIVAVAATVVSAWIINPKEGPFAWLICVSCPARSEFDLNLVF